MDYDFEGSDGQAIDGQVIESGRTLLSSQSDSAAGTWHQAVIARIADGVTTPAIDLLAGYNSWCAWRPDGHARQG